MRQLLLFILHFHYIVVSAKAFRIPASPVEDSAFANLTKTIFPRVRVGGGTAQNPKTASELFLLNDGPGSCNGQIETVNSWLKEVYQLHDAVEQAYAYQGPRPTSALLWYAFFGVKPNEINSDLYKTIGVHISRVSQFLSGGGLVQPAKTGEMPRLFCSGEAGEYQNWIQPAKDQNSDPILSSEEGKPPRYLLLSDIWQEKAQAFNSRAFWFESFKGYFFDDKGEDDLCSIDSQDGKRRFAVTARPFEQYLSDENRHYATFGQANRNILLCPIAFNGDNNVHSYPSLEQAVSANGYPTYAQRNDPSTFLDKFLTTSATLYHELYHLTDTTDEYKTNDNGPTLREIAANVRGGRELDNAHNAETYAYLAMAAYMVQNPPEGKEAILYLASKFKKESDPFSND